MPLYEYKCASWGDVFEVIQKFSDEPLHEHPGCGGPVEKLVSVSALQFKGSGWYVNDYGKKDSGGKESSSKESSAKDSGGKTKSESSSSSSDSKSSGDSGKSEKSETSKPAAPPAKET